VPILTLPFIVTSWFALGVAPHVSLTGALPVPDVFAGAGHALPHALGLLLQSLGMCLFIPTVSAGLCVLAGLRVFSRIASILAVSGAALALAVREFTHAPVADELDGRENYFLRDQLEYCRFVNVLDFPAVLRGAPLPDAMRWPPQTKEHAAHLELWMTVTHEAVDALVSGNTR
jgi:hypothetical protein